MKWVQACCIVLVWFAAVDLAAQKGTIDQYVAELEVVSGPVTNQTSQRAVVFEETVQIPDAPWLRLRFGKVTFGDPVTGGEEPFLRITSIKDGGVQILDRQTLRQWRNTSAYFNGEAVRVEMIADPGTGPGSIRIESAWVGQIPAAPESICGPTDDRELSNDPRAARLMPIECTAWLIDDANKCFLTAGHCQGSAEVVQFNVPLSNPDGTLNNPPPEDQYPVDPASLQGNGGQGVGNDWAYHGTFPNSTTGLTAFEAQGDAYVLADPPADPAGQDIRITGYGSTDPPVNNEWNQVQKTHVGPLVFVNPTTLNYQTDTTGGNSGSAVLHENTGNAIGIHTHAGCSATNGNNGTNILHPDLQNALANPQGVCAPPPPLTFDYPEGLPEFLNPAGEVIRVNINPVGGATLIPDSAMLHYDTGSGQVDVPLDEVSPGNYNATFPALDCGLRITYEFSAETTDMTMVLSSAGAAARAFIAEVATSLDVTFADNFETDMGWTVENDAGLTDGAWERDVPAGFGLRGDPAFDADGTGSCYLTDNEAGNSDVDGGRTVLISPIMDASQGDAHICYWRWYSTIESTTQDDIMTIDISDDGGATWTNIETLGPTGPTTEGGWVFSSFRVADFITANDQFRIRFDVSDLGTGSVVEAAVDGVRLKRAADPFICETVCPGDLNMDGVVDNADMLIIVAGWGNAGGTGDLNGNGLVDILDLLELMELMGDCP